VYFNVNFNVFFKLIKCVSEIYIYQNARCNDIRKTQVTVFCKAGSVIFVVSIPRRHAAFTGLGA